MRFSRAAFALVLLLATLNSIRAQTFTGTQSAGSGALTNPGAMDFYDSSTAGSSVISNPSPGIITFHNTSTAGSANINNLSSTIFQDQSTAGTSTITTWFDLSFSGQSSGDHATLFVNSGAGLGLYDTASLGSATVTNAGFIVINQSASAGNANISNSRSLQLRANSTLGSATVTNTNTSLSVISVEDSASLGSASITNNRTIDAKNTSTLGSATINNFFRINLLNDSGASSATIIGNLGASTDISGHNGPVTLGALSGRGAIELGGNFLSIGALNTSTTFAGAIASSGTFPGTGGGISKVGTGTLTLTGHNFHTGATTISAGTLVAAGDYGSRSSMGNGSAVVRSGATLAGNDYIPGIVTVEGGGHLAPGNPTAGTTGRLEFLGGLTLNDGANLDFALSSATPTYLTIASTATLTGPGGSGLVTVNLTNFGDFAAGTYTLLDFSTGTATGVSSANFALGSTIAGYNYSLDVIGSTLALTATTAVPEPATYAALLGTTALGLAITRRRRVAISNKL